MDKKELKDVLNRIEELLDDLVFYEHIRSMTKICESYSEIFDLIKHIKGEIDNDER